MPSISRINISFAIASERHARASGILTAVRRAFAIALVNFGEIMEKWAYTNVPKDTGQLISDFIATVRSSPSARAFVIGNPNISYASYVNAMRGVMWKRFGVNPAKDAYFDRALAFAFRVIPLAIVRAIKQEGIDVSLGVPASQVMQQYYRWVRP